VHIVKPQTSLDNLLENIEGKDRLKFEDGAKLFSQGEEGDAVYFIQTGKVQLSVVSAQGNEAVLAGFGPSDFLGEECLVDDSRRTSTATSMGSSTVFRVDKRAMNKALHADARFSEEFMTALLTRNLSLEEDLCDQLFDHEESGQAQAS
jgi:CRP/FNR family transcriptional regulator, cyclic AMP receptor protein